MQPLNERIESFDTIRAFSILIVFFGHILAPQSNNRIFQGFLWALNPSLSMSLMGFLSGFLLTVKYKRNYNNNFFIKRFSRIYVSLFICLSVIGMYYLWLGKKVVHLHTVFHFLGLTGFMRLLDVKNQSSIGLGLWFITAILIMYLLLPLLAQILLHKNRSLHLAGLIFLFILLQNTVGWGYTATWNVITSFTVGSYIGLNKNITFFENRNVLLSFASAVLLLLVCGLSEGETVNWRVQSLLYAFYPLAFFPLLIKLSSILPQIIKSSITLFAGISFEFYLLHYYFIGKELADIFPNIHGLILQIILSFSITFTLSFLIAKLSSKVCELLAQYFNFESSVLVVKAKE